MGRHARGPGPALLVPDCSRDILPVEPDALLAILVTAKTRIEAIGQRHEIVCIVQVDASSQGRQCHESIERTAVQQVPAKCARHSASDRAFAGPYRAVNGNDGYTCCLDIHPQ